MADKFCLMVFNKDVIPDTGQTDDAIVRFASISALSWSKFVYPSILGFTINQALSRITASHPVAKFATLRFVRSNSDELLNAKTLLGVKDGKTEDGYSYAIVPGELVRVWSELNDDTLILVEARRVNAEIVVTNGVLIQNIVYIIDDFDLLRDESTIVKEERVRGIGGGLLAISSLVGLAYMLLHRGKKHD